MIDYGLPPAEDEIEVTLFGPGYGEAIAIHFGDGSWLLVDSCINPETKNPASEEYLDSIGVTSNQVDAIVASHWHDDHVRGISKLVNKYADADFVISAAFNNKEGAAFLSAYSDETKTGLTGGSKELFASFDASDNVNFALHKIQVVDGKTVRIMALSPMHGAFAQSLAHFIQYMPKKGGSINHAPELKSNLEAIVLHIDLGDDAILLGSDLEEHANYGWNAVVNDKWSGALRPASVYKVAHHGSKSGNNKQLWTTLLQPETIACMTPWVLMGKRLPTEDDKKRVKRDASEAYITSESSNKPMMDNDQLNRLGDIATNIKLVDSSFGAVRLRKKLGAKSWDTELFGSAQKL